MKLSNQEIQKSISSLPEDIKRAVIEFDWATEIMNIGHDHHMQIDDIDLFRQQTLLVILGKSPADRYEQSLVDEVGVDRATAQSLVDAANAHIFRELQKRAFSKEVKNESSPIVEHSDVANIMRSEGVELVDHSEVESPSNDLSDKISDILGGKSEISLQQSAQQKPADIKSTLTDYQEPIDDTDLRGVSKHRIDTSILRTQKQITPHQILDADSSAGMEKPNAKIVQTLDKHIMENPFIAKGDSINMSPSEEEQITEDGKFLEHLKTTD